MIDEDIILKIEKKHYDIVKDLSMKIEKLQLDILELKQMVLQAQLQFGQSVTHTPIVPPTHWQPDPILSPPFIVTAQK